MFCEGGQILAHKVQRGFEVSILIKREEIGGKKMPFADSCDIV